MFRRRQRLEFAVSLGSFVALLNAQPRPRRTLGERLITRLKDFARGSFEAIFAGDVHPVFA